MTGPAYVIEHRYMVLAEKAQTAEGLTWREDNELHWLQYMLRWNRAVWFQGDEPVELPVQVAS